MDIGGFQGISLLDYLGEVTSIVFTTGCNFRCPFCHNGELVQEAFEPVDDEVILEKLEERKDFITAITITGGEPTTQPDLIEFLEKLQDFGVSIKLDTNGSNPEVIKKIIDEKLVDYFAMDIKAPFSMYNEVSGANVDIDRIKRSINLIRTQKDYEFRTTVIPDLLGPEKIKSTAKQVKGAKKYCLQQFEPRDQTISREFSDKRPYPPEKIKEVGEEIRDWFDKLEYRGME